MAHPSAYYYYFLGVLLRLPKPRLSLLAFMGPSSVMKSISTWVFPVALWGTTRQRHDVQHQIKRESQVLERAIRFSTRNRACQSSRFLRRVP